MKTLRIFISSPSDVQEERQTAGRVIERLQGKYWSFVKLDDVFWETRVVRSTGHYQDELVNPGECDIVIGILWSKFGSPLPPKFRKVTGDRWGSGTEWELEMAFEAYEKELERTGSRKVAKPDIIVYRRAEQRVKREESEAEAIAHDQEDKLNSYLLSEYYHTDDLESGRPTNKRPIIKYALRDFERKFESDLEELIIRQIPALKRGYEPPPISGCPFMDLRPFDFDDADRFFGRNREIRQIQDALKERAKLGSAFVLIYGGSGYGKSSLMRAGVVPVITRPGGVIDEEVNWRRVLFQAASSGGGALVAKLARMILSGAPDGAGGGDSGGIYRDSKEKVPEIGLPELGREKVPKACHTSDSTATTGEDREHGWDVESLSRVFADRENRVFAVNAVLDALKSVEGHLVLQIDQLEEVFGSVPASRRERADFFETLHDLSMTGRVWILATMRSEFFPRVSEEPVLHSLVNSNKGGFVLAPPDRQALQEIIRYPAAAGRITFERTLEVREIGNGEGAKEESKHDELDEQILSDAESSPDVLPLLEFTLRSLYDADIAPNEDKKSSEAKSSSCRVLRWNTYVAFGGLKGSIADVADRAYATLETFHQDAALGLFALLVRYDEATGKVIRRPAYVESIREKPGGAQFLDAFTKASLIVTDTPQGETRPQAILVHEALLTHWPILALWLEDKEIRSNLAAKQRIETAFDLHKRSSSKKDLLQGNRLTEAQALAKNPFFALSGDEEEFLKESEIEASKRIRRLKAAVWVFGILAVIAGLSAFWALKKQRDEVIARESAEKARNSSEEIVTSLMDELRPNLEVLERTELLVPLANNTLRYFNDLPNEVRTQATRRNHGLALLTSAEIHKNHLELGLAKKQVDQALEIATGDDRFLSNEAATQFRKLNVKAAIEMSEILSLEDNFESAEILLYQALETIEAIQEYEVGEKIEILLKLARNQVAMKKFDEADASVGKAEVLLAELAQQLAEKGATNETLSELHRDSARLHNVSARLALSKMLEMEDRDEDQILDLRDQIEILCVKSNRDLGKITNLDNSLFALQSFEIRVDNFEKLSTLYRLEGNIEALQIAFEEYSDTIQTEWALIKSNLRVSANALRALIFAADFLDEVGDGYKILEDHKYSAALWVITLERALFLLDKSGDSWLSNDEMALNFAILQTLIASHAINGYPGMGPDKQTQELRIRGNLDQAERKLRSLIMNEGKGNDITIPVKAGAWSAMNSELSDAFAEKLTGN